MGIFICTFISMIVIKYVAERGRSSKGFEKTARRDLRRYLGCKSLAEAILKNPNFRFQSEEGDIKALEVKARINREYFMYTFSARDMSNFIVGCFGTRQDLEQYVSGKYIYDLEVGLEASLMGYEDPDFDKEIEEILNAVDDDD
ncbi:MAG: hypothetical protein LUD47_04575 [Clostridia bacterium]|nr:hypothetical protein [Clostridia bacterium]